MPRKTYMRAPSGEVFDTLHPEYHKDCENLGGGSKGAEALQGAGSIKRDCLLWETWLQSRGVPYKAIKPAAGATKWDAAKFQRITGWTKRTNEHARDAALLCFGVK